MQALSCRMLLWGVGEVSIFQWRTVHSEWGGGGRQKVFEGWSPENNDQLLGRREGAGFPLGHSWHRLSPPTDHTKGGGWGRGEEEAAGRQPVRPCAPAPGGAWSGAILKEKEKAIRKRLATEFF